MSAELSVWHGPRSEIAPVTVAEMIRRSLSEDAGRILIDGPGGVWTAADVDRDAGSVCDWLASHGVGPGDRVVVVAARDPLLAPVCAAIMGTGAVYVPVDSSAPAARVEGIVAGCGAVAVITVGVDALPGEIMVPFVRAEDVVAAAAWAPVAGLSERAAVDVGGDDECYIIYTSGSTGRPKGAVNRQVSAAAHMQWMMKVFGEGVPIRLLVKAPVGFDVGVAEWLLILCGGGVAVVPEADFSFGDVPALVRIVQDFGVTVFAAVPSAMAAVVAYLDAAGLGLECFAGVRHVLLGGEAVASSLVGRCLRDAPFRVHGLYGPSETAMDVMWVDYGAVDVPRPGDPPLLGVAEDNVSVYIVDECLRPVPRGVVGELCIAGVPVGLGYVGDVEQTERAFVESLYPDIDGGVMYRTGDVACASPSGVVVFHGRVGEQVQVRGFRVELGEVEAQVCALRGVVGAVVVPVKEGGTVDRLEVVIASADGAPDWGWMRTELARRLPGYMVPARAWFLGELPLTERGKLDRAAVARWRAGVELGEGEISSESVK